MIKKGYTCRNRDIMESGNFSNLYETRLKISSRDS
jgi:hypothetical protein